MYFVIWNGHVECGVVRCGMCYNVTTPCFDTAHHHILHNTATHFHIAPHHSSIIPHLIAQHSTSFYVIQYRPRFATLHHHILHIMWCNEIWCDVSCDMEWRMKWSVVRCKMRCYTLYNLLCHITPPHIARHSCTFLWHSHINCRIICNMWWCNVECDVMNNMQDMWCGMRFCDMEWHMMWNVVWFKMWLNVEWDVGCL